MAVGLRTRIAICDDHPIVRSGFRAMLSAESDFDVVAEVGSGREAIALAERLACDVLLLDIAMPDQSGVDTLRILSQRNLQVAVLVVSGYPEEQYALNMLKFGARGYLSKDCDAEQLVRAVRTVAAGRRYVSQTVADLLANGLSNGEQGASAPHLQLSDRELQVFLHLARGSTVSQIAQFLSLSAKTVSTYRARVLDKLGLSTNSELTYYAMKNRLID